MRVLLDGKLVDDTIIDPAKHLFLGTFRYPTPPGAYAPICCRCGYMLGTVDAVFEHWSVGHFDLAQYATIDDLLNMRQLMTSKRATSFNS